MVVLLLNLMDKNKSTKHHDRRFIYTYKHKDYHIHLTTAPVIIEYCITSTSDEIIVKSGVNTQKICVFEWGKNQRSKLMF